MARIVRPRSALSAPAEPQKATIEWPGERGPHIPLLPARGRHRRSPAPQPGHQPRGHGQKGSRSSGRGWEGVGPAQVRPHLQPWRI